MSSVDVIVPCYRYGHYLKECVDSVLAQDEVQVRVLILDDASPDNTAEVGQQLAQDPRVMFSRHVANKGHIATYNEGIEWASSDYLLLLSADDYLLPGALGRAAELMDAHPTVGFTFGGALELRDGGTTREVRTLPNLMRQAEQHILTGREFIERSGSGSIVPTATAVIRTELQKRVGGYRPELPHAGDMEMWLRLASHASVGVIGALQAVYRRHSANMSLGYMERSWLPDLQQRRAALECFVQSCNPSLQGAQRLHRRMLWSLARVAVGRASAALRAGDRDGSDELLRFAVGVCPEVRSSLSWMKYVVLKKSRLAVGGRRALQPAVAWARQLMTSSRNRSK